MKNRWKEQCQVIFQKEKNNILTLLLCQLARVMLPFTVDVECVLSLLSVIDVLHAVTKNVSSGWTLSW